MVRRCTESFATAGTPARVFAAGELYDDNDPGVKAHPGMFEDPGEFVDRRDRPIPQADTRVVESTSAAPGEKRSTRVPKGTARTKGAKDDASED
jgi:hypothetical protein